MVVALRLGPPEKGKTQLAKEEATAFYLSEYNTNNATNGYVEEYQDAYTSAFECIDSYRIENLSTCFECEQYKYTNPRAYTDCKQLNNCYGYSSCLECEAFTAEAKDSCQLANNCAICQECIEAPESELLECQLQNNCLVTAPYSCTEVLNNYYQANTIANVHLAIKAKSQAIVAQNLANGVYNNSSYYFDGPTPKPHTIAALNVPAITQSTQYTNYLNSYYNQVDWQAELLPLVNQEQLTLHYMPQVEQLWLAEAETKAQLSDTSVAGVLKTMAILANQPASNYKVPELLESLNHLYGPTAGQYLLNTNGASTQQQKPMAFLQYNLTQQTNSSQIVTTAGPNVYYLYGSSRLGEQKHFAGKSNAQTYHQQHGSLTYEFTDHLGNVKLTTNNRLKLHYSNSAYHLEPTILSSVDYYAFGMVMPGRVFNTGDYRFGFNTQERTDEISGAGNHYTADFWEYNPRAVTRWNTDPVTYPWQSSYTINNNNPIYYYDPLGLWGKKSKAEREQNKDTKRYGENRVGDVFNRNEGTDKKADWGYHVFDEGKDKYTRISGNLEDGDYTISASRPSASIFDNKGVKDYKKSQGIGFFNDNGNWYNSPFMRAYMGDGFSFDLSGSASAVFGTDHSLEFNWVFRGDDASLFPYINLNSGVTVGDGAEATISASGGRLYYFSSDVRNISAMDFLGYSAYGEAGLTILGGGGAGVDVALARKNGNIVPTWIEAYVSGKLGGEGSPLTGANIKAGGRITYLMWHPKFGIHKVK